MKALEIEHLEQATRHVAEAERRIAEQRLRVAELERDGHDAGQARSLLRLFEQTYSLMVEHRRMILRHLRQSSN
jgi:hypothetical protein